MEEVHAGLVLDPACTRFWLYECYHIWLYALTLGCVVSASPQAANRAGKALSKVTAPGQDYFEDQSSAPSMVRLAPPRRQQQQQQRRQSPERVSRPSLEGERPRSAAKASVSPPQQRPQQRKDKPAEKRAQEKPAGRPESATYRTTEGVTERGPADMQEIWAD